MATYYAANGYQQPIGSWHPLPGLNDGNPATGIDLAGAVNGTVAVTAAVDLGVSSTINSVSAILGWEDVLTSAWEYSTNGTTWSSLPTPTIGAGPNGGTFALFTLVVPSGLPVTAQFVRVSCQDHGTSGAAAHAFIGELIVNPPTTVTVAEGPPDAGTYQIEQVQASEGPPPSGIFSINQAQSSQDAIDPGTFTKTLSTIVEMEASPDAGQFSVEQAQADNSIGAGTFSINRADAQSNSLDAGTFSVEQAGVSTTTIDVGTYTKVLSTDTIPEGSAIDPGQFSLAEVDLPDVPLDAGTYTVTLSTEIIVDGVLDAGTFSLLTADVAEGPLDPGTYSVIVPSVVPIVGDALDPGTYSQVTYINIGEDAPGGEGGGSLPLQQIVETGLTDAVAIEILLATEGSIPSSDVTQNTPISQGLNGSDLYAIYPSTVPIVEGAPGSDAVVVPLGTKRIIEGAPGFDSFMSGVPPVTFINIGEGAPGSNSGLGEPDGTGKFGVSCPPVHHIDNSSASSGFGLPPPDTCPCPESIYAINPGNDIDETSRINSDTNLHWVYGLQMDTCSKSFIFNDGTGNKTYTSHFTSHDVSSRDFGSNGNDDYVLATPPTITDPIFGTMYTRVISTIEHIEFDLVVGAATYHQSFVGASIEQGNTNGPTNAAYVGRTSGAFGPTPKQIVGIDPTTGIAYFSEVPANGILFQNISFKVDVGVGYRRCGSLGPCQFLPSIWEVTGHCAWRDHSFEETIDGVPTFTEGLGAPMKSLSITIFRGDCNDPGGIRTVDWHIDTVTETAADGTWSWGGGSAATVAVSAAVGVYILNPNYTGGTGVDGFGIPFNYRFKKDPAFKEYSCTEFDANPGAFGSGINVVTIDYCAGVFRDIECTPDISVTGVIFGAISGTGVNIDFNTILDTHFYAIAYGADERHPAVDLTAVVSGHTKDVTSLFFSSGGNIVVTDLFGGGGPIVPAVNSLGNVVYCLPYDVDPYFIKDVTVVTNPLTSTVVAALPDKTPALHNPPTGCSDLGPAATSTYQIFPNSAYFPDTERANVIDRVNPQPFQIKMDFGTIPCRAAASFKDIVVFAWNSGSNIIVTVHKGMAGHVGSRDGWQNTTTMAFTTSQIGVMFSNDGGVYLFTDVQNVFSRDFGATWNSIAAVSGGPIQTLGTDIGQGWTAAAYIQGGSFKWGRANGIGFVGPVLAGTNPYGGLAWIPGAWHVMCAQTGTNGTITRIRARTDTMDSNAITGLTGIPVSMARSGASTLTVLDYDSGNRSRGAWSFDGGRHWQNASAFATVIPAVTMPPVLVSLKDGVLAACWQESDVPKFSLSYDGGQTWL